MKKALEKTNISSKLKHLSKLFIYRALTKLKKIKISEFDDSTYQDKRVIVVGPANSSEHYLPGSDIDQFDLIIRINKSPSIVSANKSKIGSRTDILYHCCDESPSHGGGPILVKALAAQKNKFILFTYHDPSVVANAYKIAFKHPNINLYTTRKSLYTDLRKSYLGKMPTTGLQALNHIISTDFKELHITGFTFFKTPYASGYRDSHKSAESASALAKSTGNHDPDDELRIFIKLLSENQNKKIYMDDALMDIVAQQT
ncbi:MAG: hypothetical protein ACKVK5_06165 [Pseudomonadales bacterium]